MSKQQWGHGYYAGLKDAKDYVGKKKYLVCIGSKGHISEMYRVLKRIEDVFVIENITDCLSSLLLTPAVFCIPDDNDHSFDHRNVTEKTEDELNELINEFPKAFWFASVEGIESFCICDFNEWAKNCKKSEQKSNDPKLELS